MSLSTLFLALLVAAVGVDARRISTDGRRSQVVCAPVPAERATAPFARGVASEGPLLSIAQDCGTAATVDAWLHVAPQPDGRLKGPEYSAGALAQHLVTVSLIVMVPIACFVSRCGGDAARKRQRRRAVASAFALVLLTVLPAVLWAYSRCRQVVVTEAAQLEGVGARVSDATRQSFRLSPAVVRVEWDGALEAAVGAATAALWPASDAAPRLVPVLQAVLTYRAGDWFAPHTDRCEDNGQEGVLVVDVGLRGSGLYDAGRPEIFVHHRNGAFAANWTASGPGAWIAMPMRVLHGVYVQPSRRTVAVFTLVDPTRANGISCYACPTGSCQLAHCVRHTAGADHLWSDNEVLT